MYSDTIPSPIAMIFPPFCTSLYVPNGLASERSLKVNGVPPLTVLAP
jgi:hypothetical protein